MAISQNARPERMLFSREGSNWKVALTRRGISEPTESTFCPQKNPAVTEIKEIPYRGHSLTIDQGWQEVAETALAFIAQQLKSCQ